MLGIIDGLTEDQLRRPVLPSGWNCLGMLQHLTISDERFWFSGIMTGEAAYSPGAARRPSVADVAAAKADMDRRGSSAARADLLVLPAAVRFPPACPGGGGLRTASRGRE